MYFKRSITFRLKVDKNSKSDPRILIRASWCGNRVEFPTPHSISVDQWDKDKQRAVGKPNSIGVPTAVINADLDKLKGYMIDVFNRFEFVDTAPPSPADVKALYNDLSGRETAAEVVKDVIVTLADAYARFVRSHGNWEIGTRKKYVTIGNHLVDFVGNDMMLSDVTQDTLKDFQAYLGGLGLRNVTIERMINRVRTFLRWAADDGIYHGDAQIKHKPKLKGTNVNEVVILTLDELKQLAEYRFADGQMHLEQVRDVLLFGCYTGLRYSDIQQLTKAHVKGDAINVVTIKTADRITIELNDVTRKIIRKYSNSSDMRLLPTISNQKANKYLKELGELVGIDAPTLTTYYDAKGRHTVAKPKWQLMSTHIARRTFISNAIAMGIPAPIVMSWSGHKDFKAMKPYIRMLDEAKRAEMSKFNELLKSKNGE